MIQIKYYTFKIKKPNYHEKIHFNIDGSNKLPLFECH